MSYSIDGVRVSDFVTPSYFTPAESRGRRNDFLGVAVRSFGVTRGSHIAFFDPDAGQFVQVVGEHAPQGKRAAARFSIQEHAKPERPDDKIQNWLRQYQETTPRNGRSGLRTLGGLTRNGRYAAAAQRLRLK